jgi:phosphohistidine phosphatase
VHSGKTRARQTAGLWGELLGADVEQGDSLAPNDDPAAWAERVQVEEADLMLVGHLPHLDRLAGSLLTADPDRGPVRFRPGGLVVLERTDAAWQVSIVLPPHG